MAFTSDTNLAFEDNRPYYPPISDTTVVTNLTFPAYDQHESQDQTGSHPTLPESDDALDQDRDVDGSDDPSQTFSLHQNSL